MVTREDVLSLRVGDVVSETWDTAYSKPLPNARWRERKVVDIFVRDQDINGKEFLCGYLDFGYRAKISFSMKEGDENIRVVFKAR